MHMSQIKGKVFCVVQWVCAITPPVYFLQKDLGYYGILNVKYKKNVIFVQISSLVLLKVRDLLG